MTGIDNKHKLARELRNPSKQLHAGHSNCNTKFLKSLRLPKNYISYSKVPQHINVLDGKITAKFNNNRINIYNGAISIEKEHHLVNCTEYPSIFLSLHSAPTVVNTPLL